ncbi:MAG: tetratricopeptide repeat protein, partial [Planctomycetes bacterium]|nr:tetratricopeptide repeat protein [Planctomycetota bacterium]
MIAVGVAVASAAAQTANGDFDAEFAAGITALGAGETSKAWRAFSSCLQLVPAMSPERRPIAAFVAGLFQIETKLRAGKVEDAVVHAELVALAAAARASGAFAAERWEYYRLRAIVLLWQTAPLGTFGKELPASDRDWLLAADFFAIEDRLRSLPSAARVLRLSLAQGTDLEPTMLRELTEAESAIRRTVASGVALPDELRVWHATMLDALATYHARRHGFDRAQTYAARMAPEDSIWLRAWLALQREDHAQAIGLARQLVERGDPIGEQLLAEALEAGGDPAAALPHYDQALAAAKDPASRAAAQNGRGDCLLRLDRMAEAEAAYGDALQSCRGDSIGSLAERAETTKDLGRLAEARGEPRVALAQFLAALALGEDVRSRLLHDPFGGSWLRMHGDQATALDGVLRTWRPAGGDAWQVVHALEL